MFYKRIDNFYTDKADYPYNAFVSKISKYFDSNSENKYL